MPKQDRQALRLKHMSAGNASHKATKIKTRRAAPRSGR